MTPLQFLRQARQIHIQFLSGTLPDSLAPIYVLGNPSADLDSIISAIVYSYCANNKLPPQSPRPHIPLLNLPTPSGSDLFRLRPEFVTSLWLSTNFPALKPDEHFADSEESAGYLLRDHVITIADFAQELRRQKHTNITLDATLVDWNALPERVPGTKGQGSLGGLLSDVTFRTVGCIDHHVDENFVPSPDELPGQPVLIRPGPGSCSSLITDVIQERGLWDSGDTAEMAQIAKMALAAILIDTSKLTAEGKVTEVDTRAVEYLRGKVADSGREWDLDAFYGQILGAKQSSLDRLNFREVLDRDYKEWSEKASSGQSMGIGFCSSVKPVRWLVRKAGGSREFMDGVCRFASGKGLDAVVVMSSFTDKEGAFARELFVSAVGDHGLIVDGIKGFVQNAAAELDLVQWSGVDDESVDIPDEEIRTVLDGDEGVWRRLWIQKNTKASRKQVAPLMRDALSKL